MRTYAILLLCLMGVAATATAASTAVKPAESKDLITDILGLWEWAVGLLETLGINIIDVLAQFLPAELVDILQILIDLGILPAAKLDIVEDLLTAIETIIELGEAAFEQLVDLIPEPILSILQALWELGLFPGGSVAVRQDLVEWLLALIDVLIQVFGTEIHDTLIEVAGQFGIPEFLIEMLWDMVVPAAADGTPNFKPTKALIVRESIIDWAIQLLEELGLAALEQIAQFLPPELISILVDLVLGLPARS